MPEYLLPSLTTRAGTRRDDATETMMAREGYTVAVCAPARIRAHAHTANTFTRDVGSSVPYCSNLHAGLDMPPATRTPNEAMADWLVTNATKSDGAREVHLVIRHEIDGQVAESAHGRTLERPLPLIPERTVRGGRVVDRVADRERSFGARLHSEIRTGGRTVDPPAWLPARVSS